LINELDLLFNFLKEYQQWLRNHRISPEFVRKGLIDNYKGVLLRAFRRQKTMNWNLTKSQKEAIKFISELPENKKSLPKQLEEL